MGQNKSEFILPRGADLASFDKNGNLTGIHFINETLNTYPRCCDKFFGGRIVIYASYKQPEIIFDSIKKEIPPNPIRKRKRTWEDSWNPTKSQSRLISVRINRDLRKFNKKQDKFRKNKK